MKTYEYTIETHGDIYQQRRTITHLGEEGWKFICFVEHWGPHDGKTMLFIREREAQPSFPKVKSPMDSQMLFIADCIKHGNLYDAAAAAAQLITALVNEARKGITH